MKLIKTYENCFSLIRDLFNSGLTITMCNSRRWYTNGTNDNCGSKELNEELTKNGYTVYKILPKLTYDDGVEIRGNKSLYHTYSDLDVLHEFLEEVLKEISIFYSENLDITEEERFDFSKYLE